jgi:hypothetical protein
VHDKQGEHPEAVKDEGAVSEHEDEDDVFGPVPLGTSDLPEYNYENGGHGHEEPEREERADDLDVVDVPQSQTPVDICSQECAPLREDSRKGKSLFQFHEAVLTLNRRRRTRHTY